MRIFLVSDEPIVIKTPQAFVLDLGHESVAVNSISELLGSLRKEPLPVDVILTGVPSHPRGAAALMREVHERHPDVPTVIVTAERSVLSVEEAVSGGVPVYLHKPIRLAELELVLVRLSESTRRGSRRSAARQTSKSVVQALQYRSTT